MFRPVIVLALLAPVAAVGQALDGDLAKLQGKWKAMVGPQKTIPLMMEIKGKTAVILLTAPDGQEITLTSDLRLDETVTPKAWYSTNRRLNNGETLPDSEAIYKLENDTLTLCGARTGQPRPTEFTESPDGAVMLTVFQREQTAK